MTRARTYWLLACLGFVLPAGSSLAQAGASVDESMGSARYAIPLLVPPGNAGHQPDLVLAYDSGRVRGGAGWIGIGWKLSVQSAISRSTAHGVPYDYAGPLACRSEPQGSGHLCYAERFSLDGEELVPVGLEAGGARQRYRTRRDDGRRIHRVLVLDRWEIRDRAGNLTVYGSSPATQIRNPRTRQVFAWHIASSTDAWGNWLRYEYTPGDGVLYPRAVSYSFGAPGVDPHDPAAPLVATRRISFQLDDAASGARPDVALDYTAGFRQAVARRLVRIEVRAGPSLDLVTRYQLEYDQEPHSDRSRLIRVARQAPSGSGFASLPPHSFEYTQTTVGFPGVPRTDFASVTGLERGARPSLSETTAWGYTQQTRRLIDLNGDSLVDLYDWPASTSSTPGKAYLNDGQRLASAVSWSPVLASQPGYWWMKPLRLEVASATSSRHLAIEMLDVNGDGFPDVASDGASVDDEPLEVRLGSPSGLQSDVKHVEDWGWPGEIEQIGVDLYSGESHPTRRIDGLVDLTGDGRADLFWRRAETGTFGFAPALGNDPQRLEYRPGALSWPKPAHTAPLLSDVYAASAPPIYYQLAVEMYDVNGDGLVDHVNPTGVASAVAYNHGAGFEVPAYFPAFPRFSTSGSRVGPTPSGVMCGDSVTVDINGDGCADHVLKGGDPWDLWVFFGTCDGRYEADPSRPFELAEPTQWPSVLPPDDCAFEPAQLVDVNGDGMVDYVHDLDAIYLNPGQPPGLLRRAVTPTGEVAELEYGPAAQERAAGVPANPGLPMPRMVVKQLRLRDSGSAVPIVERFRYAAAEYDRIEREFRGFGSVRRARMKGASEDSVAERAYATGSLGRACAGNPVREEIYAGGALLRRSVHDYDASRGQVGTDGERWEKCLRIASRTEHLEGLGEAGKRVVRSEYRWQTADPFNLLAQIDWGEEPLPGAGTDFGTDGSQTTFEYLASESLSASDPYWVETVIRRRVSDPPTAPVPRTYSDARYSYADPCDPAAPVRPVPGRPGRVEGWLDRPVAKPVGLQRTCRDVHGNPTVVRGPSTPSAPDGAYQRTDYEPTFRTFPSRLVRGDAEAGEPSLVTRFTYGHEPGASCGSVRTAPAGLGLPCREVSPGGLVLASGYDEFGRIERLEEPSGVVTSIARRLPVDPRVSAETQVTTTVTAPEGSFVSRTLHDGLGRVIRSETPGAASRSETIRVERDYDHAGRVSAISLPSTSPRDVSTRFTRFEFDALGRATLRLDPDGRTRLRTSYVPLGQIDEVYFGADRESYEQRTFDGRGRLAWLETFADARGSGRPAGALRTRLRYDGASRLIGIDDPIRNDPSLCHPSAAQPLDLGPSCGAAERHESRIEYDSLGRRVWLADPDSSTTRLAYDDAGRLVRIDRAEGAAAAHSSTWAYDSLGRVTHRGFASAAGTTAGVSDASMTYYASGPAIGSLRSVDAERPDGTDYAYTYDSLGRLARREQVTDRLRFVTSWWYDSLGRVQIEGLPDGSFKTCFYDGTRLRDAGLVKDIRWDALGRATDYFSGYVRFRYAFDPQTARLAQIRATRNAYTATDFLKLDVEIDGLGRNVALSGSVDGDPLSRSFEYDGLGRLTRALGEWERPLGTGAPVSWEFRYDPLGNLRTQTSDGGAGGYQRSWDYAHPSKPHALSRFTEVRSGLVSSEQVVVDAAGRTDSVLRIGAGGVAWRDYDWNAQGLFRGIAGLPPGYFYDVFGARVMQKSGAGTSAQRVIYVGDDFEYNDFDRWGNTLHLLGGEIVTSTGRAWTAPRQDSLAAYAARGTGWVLLVGGPLLWIGLRRTRSRRIAPPAWARSAVAGSLAICVAIAPVPLGASPPVPDAPGSHGTHRADLLVYVRDHLGSVRAVVDYPEARLVEKRDYGPFGERIAHQGSFELQHQYAGQLRDEDLDLEFANARMYDRRWGRFISPDPVASGFSAEQLNRYAYALDQPTSLRDPSGRDPRADAKNRAELIGPHVGETVSVTAQPGGGIDLGTSSLPGDFTLTLDIQFAIASALDTALLHLALEGIPLLGEVGVTAGGASRGIETVEVGGDSIPPDFPRDPIVFLAWRPVRFLGVPVGWHSFLAIWDPATGGIYRQFSLTAPERRFDLDADSDTYQTDRAAFENPGGRNLIFPITPPAGQGSRDFAERVYAGALALELPDSYSVTGPYNSNWAATHPLSELGAAYAIPDGLAPGAIPYVP